jgi:peptidoglycan hydrolase CwlO-like protein
MVPLCNIVPRWAVGALPVQSEAMSKQEIESEIARLDERITELRSLQNAQKHLPFITCHIQEHIDKLQQRIADLRSDQVA